MDRGERVTKNRDFIYYNGHGKATPIVLHEFCDYKQLTCRMLVWISHGVCSSCTNTPFTTCWTEIVTSDTLLFGSPFCHTFWHDMPFFTINTINHVDPAIQICINDNCNDYVCFYRIIILTCCDMSQNPTRIITIHSTNPKIKSWKYIYSTF